MASISFALISMSMTHTFCLSQQKSSESVAADCSQGFSFDSIFTPAVVHLSVMSSIAVGYRAVLSASTARVWSFACILMLVKRGSRLPRMHRCHFQTHVRLGVQHITHQVRCMSATEKGMHIALIPAQNPLVSLHSSSNAVRHNYFQK